MRPRASGKAEREKFSKIPEEDDMAESKSTRADTQTERPKANGQPKRHLVTALTLMHGADTQQTYTYNAAGVGAVGLAIPTGNEWKRAA